VRGPESMGDVVVKGPPMAACQTAFAGFESPGDGAAGEYPSGWSDGLDELLNDALRASGAGAAANVGLLRGLQDGAFAVSPRTAVDGGGTVVRLLVLSRIEACRLVRVEWSLDGGARHAELRVWTPPAEQCVETVDWSAAAPARDVAAALEVQARRGQLCVRRDGETIPVAAYFDVKFGGLDGPSETWGVFDVGSGEERWLGRRTLR
jgi:hypothetical protein